MAIYDEAHEMNALIDAGDTAGLSMYGDWFPNSLRNHGREA